jgi:methionine synthase II (cobalamin-independent)
MAGKLAPDAFSDAKTVAARAAIKDQKVANVEVVSDGELFRRDDTRFGPPNAMINPRDVAFAKLRAMVAGTHLAKQQLVPESYFE